jgi:long-chain acyl-CoA synthetase
MAATLGEVIGGAASHADRTALIVGDGTWTYAELDRSSDRVADGLVGLDVRPDDRVSIFGANAFEWVAAYYGAAKVGAVLNPLSSMLTEDELRYTVGDAGARVVIASADKADALRSLKDDGIIDHAVTWGGEQTAGMHDLHTWLRAEGAPFATRPRAPGDPAVIAYTSGTTGRPKGAVQSHRAVVAAAVGTAVMAARTKEDRVISALPLFHVYGSCVLNASVLTGSTLITLPRFDADALLRGIESHCATVMDGVPTAYYYLLAHPAFDRFDLSSLRRAWVGGQTLPAAKSVEFTRRTGCPVHEVWGMTELAGAASANPVYAANKPGTIGQPFPGNSFRVVDIDDPDRDMAEGEPGELLFRGPMVMTCYHANPDATAETVLPGGWVRTGDIATLDADGYATIVDRKKDMILTAGFNVYPAELERVLCMHPAVALAAVGRVPDDAKGELAKAYVVRHAGTDVSEAELIAHCRGQLAAYKVPRAVQFVADVPKTASGKVMRRMLASLDNGAPQHAPCADRAPKTAGATRS